MSTIIKKRIISIILSIALFTGTFFVNPSEYKAEAAYTYDASKALAYAKSHWNDGVGLCAEFVSNCVNAGGLNIGMMRTVWLMYTQLPSKLGVSWQKLTLTSDGYATKSANADKLAAGDIVISFCFKHEDTPHVMLCGGYSSSGLATFYAHNNPHNNDIVPANSGYCEYDEDDGLGALVLHITDVDTVSSDTLPEKNPGYPYTTPWGTYSKGDYGDEVRWLQTALNNVMGADLPVDGSFGNMTYAAVTSFQAKYKLTVDGIAGSQTIGKLNSVWPALYTEKHKGTYETNPGYSYLIPSSTVKKGDTGDDVCWVQTALNNIIDAGLPVDGSYGPLTTAAAKNYLYSAGLSGDGATISTSTISAMVDSWAAMQAGSAPTITKQPKNASAPEGAKVKFTVKCDDDVTYQWQTSKNNGVKWVDSSFGGYNTDTLTVPVTEARDGYLFRCVVTNSNKRITTSSSAKLTVTDEPFLITDGPDDVEATVDTVARFTVQTTEDAASYQWQASTDGGNKWKTSTLTGSKTATLSVKATEARDGYLFRCVVSDINGSSETSAEAELTVLPYTPFTVQPESVTASVNEEVSFNASVEDKKATYQWEVSTDKGANWTASGLTGNKTGCLKVTATKKRSGYMFRCAVTLNEDGESVTYRSAEATLTVK